MSDIIDITVQETIDVVDITVNPNIIEVNVTRTSGGGGGGSQNLQQVTDEGNTTTNDIIVSKETGTSFIQVENNNNTLTFQVDSADGSLIELNDTTNGEYGSITVGEILMTAVDASVQITYNYLGLSNNNAKPYIELSGSDGTLTGSVSIKTDLIDGSYEQQLPNKSGTFAMLDDVPTKTSDLINDGEDGINPFITLEDLPSNLILYPTTVASGIGGYNKLVSSITDPDYDTTAVDVSTGTITGTDQLIAGLITSPNIIVGNPGIFNITTIGNIRKVSGAGQAEFYFRVYKRDVGGTETLILQSSNTPQITSAIYTEFSATGLWNDGVFISTDMIVMKFYGTKVGSGSSPTYDFQFGGTQPVRTLVPIPLTVVPNLSFNELSDVEITSPTNNQIPAYESATSLWKNKDLIDILETFNRTQGIYYFEDFIGSQSGNLTTSYGQVITLLSGTGAGCTTTNAILNKTNQQGVVRHTTGTLLSGNAGFTLGNASLFIGQGAISIETYTTIETLSNATERFFTFFGYGVPSNWQNNPNAIFITYDEGGSINFNAGGASANFKCYTKLASVTTVTTTSVPVVASQWYKLRIEINNTGNSVGFYIDGDLVATHTTNIPLNTTAMSVVNLINKTVGTTARTMQTDYFMYEEIFTTAR